MGKREVSACGHFAFYICIKDLAIFINQVERFGPHQNARQKLTPGGWHFPGHAVKTVRSIARRKRLFHVPCPR
jgi:hypothetical protein